ncbi:MAG: crotonase/enoyl-CoA hydratase family protein [Parvularculaceae bacterium]
MLAVRFGLNHRNLLASTLALTPIRVFRPSEKFAGLASAIRMAHFRIMEERLPLILIERDGPVFIVTINRPERRNAVDRATADALVAAFRAFDADDALSVAILTGAGGHFCAGADLKAVAEGKGNRIEPIDDGPRENAPMGPTRMILGKPVIAAVEGNAVAGGLELALWCDMRVAARNATFGVYCRRFGVPLIDGGTVRLPRLIGQARAMEMILTGRAVGAEEALAWGLANRLAAPGGALGEAKALAKDLAALPQTCLRNDRASALAQWGLTERDAMANEFRLGLETLESGETLEGAARFAGGEGRGGGKLDL